MLSDEANLVGTSKNLFASQDRHLHRLGQELLRQLLGRRCGHRPTAGAVPVPGQPGPRRARLLVQERLPVQLDGAAGLRASCPTGWPSHWAARPSASSPSLLVVAHPITLISVRSGGFDFLAVCFALLVLKSLLDYVREPSPERLAILWMNLCMFAEIRYESALFLPPVVALLLLFRMVNWSTLRPYAFIYALTPAYLLPRIWQAMLARERAADRIPGRSPSGSRTSSATSTSTSSPSCRPSIRIPLTRAWSSPWASLAASSGCARTIADCSRAIGTPPEVRHLRHRLDASPVDGRLHLRVGTRPNPRGRASVHRRSTPSSRLPPPGA